MKLSIIVGSIIYSCILLSGYSYANEMENTQSGSELFKKHCAPCHGDNAIGQDPKQPSGGFDADMNRLAPALNGTAHAWHHSPSLFYEYIQNGSISESSPMPSFGDRLNDSDIKSIIVYVQSLWPNEIINNYKERFKDVMQ